MASLELGAHRPLSVALGGHGQVAFTAGADGQLRALSRGLSGSEGELTEVASLAIAGPVTVRAAADGEHLFVGTEEGFIHLIGCAE